MATGFDVDWLGKGLGWKPETPVFMLWVYFDESSKHDSLTGHPLTIVVGGGLARSAQWDRLSVEWTQVLLAAGIKKFHANEFAHSQGEFKGWQGDEARRRAFLNQLLDIIGKHVLCVVGVRQPVTDAEPFAETYGWAAKMALSDAWQLTAGDDYQFEEKLSVVFANHKEFSHMRIGAFADALKNVMPNIRSITGGLPQDLPQLQVADLLAYEIMRWDGGTDPDYWRYPLRKLHSTVKHWHLWPFPRWIRPEER